MKWPGNVAGSYVRSYMTVEMKTTTHTSDQHLICVETSVKLYSRYGHERTRLPIQYFESASN